MTMNNISENKGRSKIVADTRTSKRKHILFDKIPNNLAVGQDEGKGEGVWAGHVHTVIFKMENQQGPTV